MGSTSAVELDFGSDFLTHSTKASGSGFLANWKEDGRIVVWLHPEAPMYSLWGHSFNQYREVPVEKGSEEKKTIITGMRVNCLENEKLLKKQNWRDKETDEREVPPRICPHCLVVEYVRNEINEGRMEWSTPLFKFETEEEEEEIIYAGGFCGLFQKRDLSKKELAQVRKTGVKLNEAFMQNGYARQQYVMGAASDADPDAGWMIAMEGKTLGDKLKKSIRDEIRNCEGDMQIGHPKFNPYPFEWMFDDNKEYADKYDVVALSRRKPSNAIQRLIKEEEAPDFSRIIEDPKLGTLKELMANASRAAGVELPLDELFEKGVDEIGEHFYDEDDDKSTDDADDDADASDDDKSTDDADASDDDKSTDDADDDADASDDDESVDPDMVDDEDDHDEEDGGCDVCDASMGADDMVCGECGAKYEADDSGDIYLASRKCGNGDCMEREVPVDDDGGGTCPQCGAVHKEDWTFKLPTPKATSKKAGKKASRKASKKAVSKPNHDDARPSRRSRARAALSE